MLIKALTIWLLLALSGSLSADILVDRSIIDVTAGETRRSDFHVYNQGDTDSDVSIDVYRVLNPGLSNEQRVSPDNPREMGLLATPRQFSVAPGERRKVRLSFLHLPSDSDSIYRIRVKPSATQDEPSPQSNMIKVVFNYELLVSYRPPLPASRYTVSSAENTLTFEHSGNSNFLLYAGRQCPDQTADNCQPLPAKRLYKGASHSFELAPGTRYVHFLFKDAGEARLLEFCGQPLKSCTVKARR